MTFASSDIDVRSPRPHPQSSAIRPDASETERALHDARAALAEKDLLLREMHHRMKNDLQVVCSLLWLHASQIDDPIARALFKAGEERVHAIAMLHQKLAESSHFGCVHFSRYAEGLASAVMKARVVASPIEVTIDSEEVLLPMEQAVPCGLILNELLTNAQKHAFPHGYAEGAKVTIDIHRREGHIEMTVADNGVGLAIRRKPPKKEGVGAKLVRMLTAQLDGTMQVTTPGGTRSVLSFPALLLEDCAR